MDQGQALKVLQSGENVFLTGSAGTGKTFLLNQFIKYLKENDIRVGVTASTGIAATHLEGRTIHSWAGIGIEQEMNDSSINKLAKNKEFSKKIRKTKVLIIDEISMFDARRLDLVDRICKVIREPFMPFGGIQIVLCGDFFQLPPIERNQESPFAYKSMVWRNSNIKICYLDKQFRQKDLEFISILNKIRRNEIGQKELDLLQMRLDKQVNYHVNPTKIYTHNIDVDSINNNELARIPKDESAYYMTHYGSADLVKFLKKSCLAPEELKLKIGAVVMFVKNNFDSSYVNGTLGKVVDFENNDDNYPIIEIKSGKKITATPTIWRIHDDNENTIASIKQIPLRLAWAITVHKSQGMSLDVAEIDLSKSFEKGMGYVALSRVKSLDGIRLIGINKLSLKVNQLIVEKDKEFKELSKQLEKSLYEKEI